jgi:hypothetical protein
MHFTCPKCAGHHFGSLSNQTRMCLGYLPSRYPEFPGAQEPCTFTWTPVDDWLYGMCSQTRTPENSGVFDVPAFVSDTP